MSQSAQNNQEIIRLKQQLREMVPALQRENKLSKGLQGRVIELEGENKLLREKVSSLEDENSQLRERISTIQTSEINPEFFDEMLDSTREATRLAEEYLKLVEEEEKEKEYLNLGERSIQI